MPDNFPVTPGTGRNVATDQVSWSDDTADIQLMRPVLVSGSEGSKTVVELTGDSTNGLDVDVTRLPAPLATSGAGTEAAALRVTIANNSTGLVGVHDNNGSITIDGNVAGNVAHDEADSGNPLKIGAQAIAHGSNPTAVAAADRTNLYANRHGVLFSIGGHPNVQTISASYIATQTNTAVISVSAGTKIVITSLSIYCDAGGTGPLDIQVGFGTSTITSTKAIIDHPGLAKGSGVVLGNGAGIVAIGADDEDLRITASGFGTGDELTICVSYYTIES